jgi:Prophage minor tail protein Z (GPZ)
MQLNVKTNFPAVAKAIAQLRSDVATKATASALNRTVEQAKTAMSREIRDEFVLPAAKVNQALRIKRARATSGRFNLEAVLDSPNKRGRSLNLANFSARQTARGVSFKVKRGGTRRVIPGSFLINGGKTVMIRTSRRRLPIKALQTIDVAQMFNTKRINSKVVKFIEGKFPEIFARDVKFFTNRFNGANK